MKRLIILLLLFCPSSTIQSVYVIKADPINNTFQDLSNAEETKNDKKEDISENDHIDNILELVDPDNIRTNLRKLTLRPHLAGTEAEHELAQLVYDTWVEQGFDKVNYVPYDTLLSYPSDTQPNLINIVTKENEVIWTSQPKQKPLYAEEEFSKEVPFTFNAYSPPGNATGEIVYVNYGQESDFNYLESNLNVSVAGRIVIAKYGKVFRANIVDSAERRQAAGVILFTDPADYAPNGTNPEVTYPNTIMMPETAVQAGTVYLSDGDPLTPFYPSVESAFKIPMEEASIPSIPVQPISYSDAWHILCNMTGKEAPESWVGGLNCTYLIGPGLSLDGALVNMDVHTHPENVTIYNVVAVMEGAVEPDRYVGIGNHRDAWVFGAVDPSSGTAAMLEVARAFAEYSKTTGWRPRRSIVFCSWAAEEYGLVGSQEWVEQFGKQLSDNMIAYLNVDMAIEGNYTLRAISAPLLYKVLWDTSLRVSNPDPEEIAVGHLTVFDTWIARKPDPNRPGYPQMMLVGSGSDYKAFQHNLGIPVLDIIYTSDNSINGDLLYHTLYETFALVNELYDQGFHFHAALVQVWAGAAAALAAEVILPFSLSEYPKFLKKACDEIMTNHNTTLLQRNITMEYFMSAIDTFELEVSSFEQSIDNIDINNPMEVRRVNDQMMRVERAFIDRRGLPNRPHYNHVVTAPSIYDSYSGTAFSGLTDALIDIESATDDDDLEKYWRTFEQHLGVVTHYINSASKVLSGKLW